MFQTDVLICFERTRGGNEGCGAPRGTSVPSALSPDREYRRGGTTKRPARRLRSTQFVHSSVSERPGALRRHSERRSSAKQRARRQARSAVSRSACDLDRSFWASSGDLSDAAPPTRSRKVPVAFRSLVEAAVRRSVSEVLASGDRLISTRGSPLPQRVGSRHSHRPSRLRRRSSPSPRASADAPAARSSGRRSRSARRPARAASAPSR